LIDFLETASQDDLDAIAMIAEFDISRPDNRVEYDIWFSSADDKMYDFIEDFAKVDAMFGESVLMTPRHVVWACPECEEDFKKNNCFGNGKYCALNPTHPDKKGTNIMIEDLRSSYIYEKFYENPETRYKWWSYITEV